MTAVDISADQWEAAKQELEVELPLGKALQDSLVVEPQPAALAAGSNDDTMKFSFDIKILAISGTISRSGRLEIKGTIAGIQIGDTVVDLSKGEVCQHPSVGKLEELKYCFALKGSCLYTSGYVSGWFHSKESWDEKILCF